jgi:hypothetical protein
MNRAFASPPPAGVIVLPLSGFELVESPHDGFRVVLMDR